MEDLRKIGLKKGLRQLTNREISTLLSWGEEIITDDHNYHEGNFCPLGIALNLNATVEDPTDEKVRAVLHERGYKVFNTRGIRGNFYTDRRKEDLMLAAKEIIKERGVSGNSNRIYLDPNSDRDVVHRT